jgi:hypothetical protein
MSDVTGVATKPPRMTIRAIVELERAVVTTAAAKITAVTPS